jgi:hypothetical protein
MMPENAQLPVIISSFAGAMVAAITFSLLLHDKVLVYLRQQNADLLAELTKLSEQLRIIRTHQHETALHLVQQDIDADNHANDVIKATAELTSAGGTGKIN